MTDHAVSDESESGRSADVPSSKYRKGSALIRAILERGEELGLDRHGIADAAGITYSYLILILNGSREVPKISHQRLRSIGKFLGIPFAQVLMLAEVLEPSDFVMEEERDLEDQLEAVYASMCRHPDWRDLAPPRRVWDTMDEQAKVTMGLMYQKLAQEALLDMTPIVEVVNDEDEG